MTVFRKLLFTEAQLYQEHLLRLDRDSRYYRFSGTVSDGSIIQYCSSIDWRCAAILGFFKNGQLHGAAEIRYEPRAVPTRAELAFSVEPAYQNTRIGSKLMNRALVILRNRGVHKADIICQIQNRRMQLIALQHQSSYQSEGGEVFMTIDIPDLSAASLLTEVLEDSENLVAAVLDYWQALLPGLTRYRPS